MGFFNKEKAPKMPPLVEAPKAGEPIVFDEEEQQAIDKEVKRRLEYLEHDSGGKVFPKEVTGVLSVGFATDALRDVVQWRINRNDLKSAASTCMKLLGVSQEPSGDWLLLARILALYGDATGAKHFISVAKKEHRKHGETRDIKAYWKRHIQDIEDIINSEVNKKK